MEPEQVKIFSASLTIETTQTKVNNWLIKQGDSIEIMQRLVTSTGNNPNFVTVVIFYRRKNSI